MDLWSYLLKPVQRISKYSLLLQDMVRECDSGQMREIAELKAALEVIHFQLRHGNNLLAMDAIHHCDVRKTSVLLVLSVLSVFKCCTYLYYIHILGYAFVRTIIVFFCNAILLLCNIYVRAGKQMQAGLWDL